MLLINAYIPICTCIRNTCICSTLSTIKKKATDDTDAVQHTHLPTPSLTRSLSLWSHALIQHMPEKHRRRRRRRNRLPTISQLAPEHQVIYTLCEQSAHAQTHTNLYIHAYILALTHQSLLSTAACWLLLLLLSAAAVYLLLSTCCCCTFTYRTDKDDDDDDCCRCSFSVSPISFSPPTSYRCTVRSTLVPVACVQHLARQGSVFSDWWRAPVRFSYRMVDGAEL